MALSNTAVPKYYGRFRDAVIRGDIPVCREIEMEMNRIDDLIANPGIYYDDEAVEGWIAYCEGELTLTDGSDLILLDTFKLWGEQVFGWYYYVERSVYKPNDDGHGGHYVRKRILKRLINKQYLIVGRGAAKSLYDSCIQSYFQNVDTSTTHQITTAPTMKQAEEVMSPIRTAITRSHGPLFRFLTDGSLQNTTGSRSNRMKLAATKKGIENFLTGSLLEIRPMSINKLQGLRVKVATVDEWLSGDIREDVIGAIEQGASKVDDYLIIATSSEGTVRNGSGDDIKMELTKILKGEYVNPHVSIWWYKLDSIDEVGDPDMWAKANPNLGKTVTYETYQLDVERAEKAPSTRNDILAKRFGIPMEGYTYEFEKPPWSGTMLKLPYNLDVADNGGTEVSLINYIGREHPVTYYGTQRGSTSTWNVEVVKEDVDTLYLLRRLQRYAGDVYVREPSGSGYWANVVVSFSQKHCELTIPVTLNITRVEGGV